MKDVSFNEKYSEIRKRFEVFNYDQTPEVLEAAWLEELKAIKIKEKKAVELDKDELSKLGWSNELIASELDSREKSRISKELERVGAEQYKLITKREEKTWAPRLEQKLWQVTEAVDWIFGSLARVMELTNELKKGSRKKFVSHFKKKVEKAINRGDIEAIYDESLRDCLVLPRQFLIFSDGKTLLPDPCIHFLVEFRKDLNLRRLKPSLKKEFLQAAKGFRRAKRIRSDTKRMRLFLQAVENECRVKTPLSKNELLQRPSLQTHIQAMDLTEDYIKRKIANLLPEKARRPGAPKKA